MKSLNIASASKDIITDLVIDTMRLEKQALIFVNTKRSAEATAEKVAKKTHINSKELEALAQNILSAATSPTKQCERLAKIVRMGHAFHHAGLISQQRTLIEDAFRKGLIKTISATPTLAAGVDTPAFRTIIRDTKRFSGAGMTDIPVLEYLQMCGRAGRPDYGDDYGEAILIAKTQSQAQQLTEKYVQGQPEAIYSKVSAQPVLRTYCLSLAASEYVKTTDELIDFFNDTFFAHQYGDAKAIEKKLLTTVSQLREWGFLKSQQQAEHEDFASADQFIADQGQLQATPLGKRVSELYLDPLSAHELIDGMYKASTHKPPFFAWLHLLCCSAEMRPLLRIKNAEYEDIQQFLKENTKDLLINEPSLYEPTYEQYLESVKTAQMLHEWCEETSEEDILERYNVRPGELRARVSIADWLLYSASELARILKFHHHIAPINKTRTRLKYGAKQELLALLKLKNIGRVRARKLYKNKIRTLQAIKDINAQTLADIIGSKTAKSLKKQVGQDVNIKETSPRKRKGQLSLNAKRFQQD